MNILFINLVIVAAIAVGCCAIIPPDVQCQNQNFDDLENRIKIVPCSSNKCNLPREKNITVAFTFSSDKVVNTLMNKVHAVVLGVPLPFLGVTETDACKDVRAADTDEPASCPLEPGKEYVYTNQFFIHSFYPTTNLLVHWSLDDGDRQVICFEVPAAIVKRSKKVKKGKYQ